MVTVTQLREVRPQLLAQVGQEWLAQAAALERVADNWQLRVVRRLAGWTGPAAEVAGFAVTALQREMAEAVPALRAAGRALQEASSRIAEAQTNLEKAFAVAGREDLTIGADGSVSCPPTHNPLETAGKANDVWWLSMLVSGALRQATEADVALTVALRQGADLAAAGLQNVNSPHSWQQRFMHAMAGEAAALLAQGSWSIADLERLAGYEGYVHDPQFATALMTALGPEKLLWVSGRLAANIEGIEGEAEKRSGFLARVGAMLGMSLATATTMANPAHVDKRWVEGLKAAGEQRVDIDVPGYRPYGYQLIGNLLRRGAYSSGFLNDVGADLLAFEVERGGAGVWMANQPMGAHYGLSLDAIDGQGGFDPMSGLMQALSRNGEASRAFFDPRHTVAVDGESKTRIDYLLTDREWPTDPPHGQVGPEGDHRPGLVSLGRALEAATAGPPRDTVAASIVSETVSALANDNHFRHGVRAPVRGSVGSMLAHWIDDVNFSVQHGGDPKLGLFSLSDREPLPGLEGAHAVFRDVELLRVLGETARDPDAYARLHEAQRAYTAMAFHHYGAGGVDALNGTAGTSAQVFGALHDARADEIRANHGAAYNEAVARRGAVADLVLSTAASTIPNPVASELAKQGAGALVHELVENARRDSTTVANFEIADVYGDGRANMKQLAAAALWRHGQVPVEEQQRFPELFDAGKPRPLADIYNDPESRQQWEAYRTSRQGQLMVGTPVLEIVQSYSAGRDRLREATSGG